MTSEARAPSPGSPTGAAAAPGEHRERICPECGKVVRPVPAQAPWKRYLLRRLPRLAVLCVVLPVALAIASSAVPSGTPGPDWTAVSMNADLDAVRRIASSEDQARSDRFVREFLETLVNAEFDPPADSVVLVSTGLRDANALYREGRSRWLGWPFPYWTKIEYDFHPADPSRRPVGTRFWRGLFIRTALMPSGGTSQTQMSVNALLAYAAVLCVGAAVLWKISRRLRARRGRPGARRVLVVVAIGGLIALAASLAWMLSCRGARSEHWWTAPTTERPLRMWLGDIRALLDAPDPDRSLCREIARALGDDERAGHPGRVLLVRNCPAYSSQERGWVFDWGVTSGAVSRKTFTPSSETPGPAASYTPPIRRSLILRTAGASVEVGFSCAGSRPGEFTLTFDAGLVGGLVLVCMGVWIGSSALRNRLVRRQALRADATRCPACGYEVAPRGPAC